MKDEKKLKFLINRVPVELVTWSKEAANCKNLLNPINEDGRCICENMKDKFPGILEGYQGSRYFVTYVNGYSIFSFVVDKNAEDNINSMLDAIEFPMKCVIVPEVYKKLCSIISNLFYQRSIKTYFIDEEARQ